MIDSHCHLDFPDFDTDRDQVLARAAESGVTALINPGTDLESSRRAVMLAEQHANVYAAVGVHPHDASSLDRETLAEVRQLAGRAGVVAIGEIGLDYYRDLSPRDVQRDAFERQLALAADLDLPVIVHQRESAADVMAALRDRAAGGQPGCVLHAFSGDQAMADEAVALGFYLGIGGPLTFKNARDLPEIVTRVPLAHLVIETDAPYLAPHPYRGKRNEPAYVALVAARLAELLGLPPDDVTAQLTDNTRRLFRLPPAD
jgi:TatD DNase family protein